MERRKVSRVAAKRTQYRQVLFFSKERQELCHSLRQKSKIQTSYYKAGAANRGFGWEGFSTKPPYITPTNGAATIHSTRKNKRLHNSTKPKLTGQTRLLNNTTSPNQLCNREDSQKRQDGKRSETKAPTMEQARPPNKPSGIKSNQRKTETAEQTKRPRGSF
jgi:hypothetical protein